MLIKSCSKVLAIATSLILTLPLMSSTVDITINDDSCNEQFVEGGKIHVEGQVFGANTMTFDLPTRTWKSTSTNADGAKVKLYYRQWWPNPDTGFKGTRAFLLDEDQNVTFNSSQTAVARYDGWLSVNMTAPELTPLTSLGNNWYVWCDATFDPGSPDSPRIVASCWKAVNLKWKNPPTGPPAGGVAAPEGGGGTATSG